MSRFLVSTIRSLIKYPINQVYNIPKSFTTLSSFSQKSFNLVSNASKYNCIQPTSLLNRLNMECFNCINQPIQIRNLTKFSLRKGKRKTVKSVLKRFYRLDWGIWIRGKCGRNKKLYKKSANRKRRLNQHVFCNGTQSHLLDTMVTKYWRRPKYYVDDPYEPYHKREEFPLTRKKPNVPPFH